MLLHLKIKHKYYYVYGERVAQRLGLSPAGGGGGLWHGPGLGPRAAAGWLDSASHDAGRRRRQGKVRRMLVVWRAPLWRCGRRRRRRRPAA